MFLGAIAFSGGCREAPQAPAPGPRPVEAVELSVSDPSVQLRLPGIVRSWAEEDISFEVSGHVDYVRREGERVAGRWAEGDKVLVEGDVLARLDSRDFEAAVSAAEADLEAARIERDRVGPASLAEARAQAAETRDYLERAQGAYEQGAVSETEMTEARTADEVAIAQVATAEASIAAAGAAVLRAEATLSQARLNLGRTDLRAPFTGEVAETYLVAGAYARPTKPVLRLTMLDPIEIDLQVSAETSRGIARNDVVRVFVGGYDEPVRGKVERKSTTADPGTQTFTVTIIARNRRVAVNDRRVADDAAGAVAIADVGLAQLEHEGQPGPLFVDERRILRRDAQGWHVWAIEGWTFDGAAEPRPDRLVLRRIAVTPGSDRLNYQGTYILRSLDDAGTLGPNQALAVGVPPGARDGATAVLTERRWVFRPGDLVQVDLDAAPAGAGVYVPQEAVIVTGENAGRLYLVGEGSTARAVPVRLGPVVNGLQRVESPQLDEAPAGSRVITRGAHSVADGDVVSIVGEGR